MSSTSMETTMIGLIRQRKEDIEPPRNACEAYSRLLIEAEQAAAASGALSKLMKELWIGVKQDDAITVAAYCNEIESACRNTAAAYASMAAVAGLSAEAEA